MTTGGDVRHLEDQPSAEVIRDLDILLNGVGGEMSLGVERRVRKRRRRTYAVAGAAAIALVSWMILPDRVIPPPTPRQDLLSIPAVPNAQAATPVALDVYGANPMAYADMLIGLRGLLVQNLFGSQAFFFGVPNQRGPYLVKMLPEVVVDGGVLEPGATVSVTGMVYAMSDSVADAWIASGGLAASDRMLAVFNESFFEAARVTVTGG